MSIKPGELQLQSVMVALYFVVADDVHDAEDGALFGLSPALLSKCERDRTGIPLSEEPEIKKLTCDAFTTGKLRSNRILPFFPDQFDIRHIAQATTMTIHGRADELYDKPFKDECIVRFRVSHGCKASIRMLLPFMGLKRANLFPDLSNLAEEISRLQFMLPDEQDQSAS